MILKLEGGYVVTPERDDISVETKDIYIENGILRFEQPVNPPDRIINVAGNVILPGLVNTHNHIYSALSRGIPCDVPFGDFLGNLKNLWWVLDSSLSKEEVLLSTVIALRDSIKQGVTTIFDHHVSGYTENALSDIAGVFDSFGISGALAFESSDRNGPDFFEKSLYENIRFSESQKGKSVRGMIGLHASFTLSDSSLKAVAYTSDNHPIHIHIAEGEIDEANCRDKYGLSLIERLRGYSLLRDNSIFVHCSNCSEKDLNIMSGKKIFVSQAVDSNMNNGLNVGNISKFISKGIRVTAGTDGMHQSSLRAMKNSMLVSKFINRDCDSGFHEMNSLLLNGYQIKQSYGIPLGIKEGEPADLSVFDYRVPSTLNSDNFLSHFIYGITESECRYVIKQDKLLLDDYHIAENPLDELLNDSKDITAQLFRKFEANKGKYL